MAILHDLVVVVRSVLCIEYLVFHESAVEGDNDRSELHVVHNHCKHLDIVVKLLVLISGEDVSCREEGDDECTDDTHKDHFTF